MGDIAILFPGQGSQYPGMGKRIYTENQIVRDVFEEACDILHKDIVKLCFKSSLDILTKTENAQISVYVVSVACYKILEKAGIVPSYLLGNSLGELSALTCAGAISFEDGLKLVLCRGHFMQLACDSSDSGMIAINGVGPKIIEDLCIEFKEKGKYVDITNYNSPTQVVIGATNDILDEVILILEQRKYSFKRLIVNGAFHSLLMQRAVKPFKDILQTLNLHELKIPVISNVTAKEYTKETVINNLSDHLILPVRWSDSINLIKEKGINIFIEAGTKNILGKLLKETYGEKCQHIFFDSSKDNMPIYEVCNSGFEMKRHKICFEEYKSNLSKIHNKIFTVAEIKNFINNCLKFAIATPNLNGKNIEPLYRTLRQYSMQYDRQEKEIVNDDLLAMYENVFKILCKKGTSKGELNYIMNRLCQDIEPK